MGRGGEREMEEEIGLDKRERERGFEGDHILIHDLHDSSDFKVFKRVSKLRD